MDAAVFKLIIDAGNFGLLVGVLFIAIPRLLDRLDQHGDKRDATFREEMKAEREEHTRERSEDRAAFTAAIDRNSRTVDANTQETKALAELIRNRMGTR